MTAYNNNIICHCGKIGCIETEVSGRALKREVNENPTHMILQFSSSHGGAFIGSPGNTLWVDNVKLVY